MVSLFLSPWRKSGGQQNLHPDTVSSLRGAGNICPPYQSVHQNTWRRVANSKYLCWINENHWQLQSCNTAFQMVKLNFSLSTHEDIEGAYLLSNKLDFFSEHPTNRLAKQQMALTTTACQSQYLQQLSFFAVEVSVCSLSVSKVST